MQKGWRNLYDYKEEVLNLKKRERGKAFVRCYLCGRFLFSGDITIVEIRKKGNKKMRRFCSEKKNDKYCYESVPFSPVHF